MPSIPISRILTLLPLTRPLRESCRLVASGLVCLVASVVLNGCGDDEPRILETDPPDQADCLHEVEYTTAQGVGPDGTIYPITRSALDTVAAGSSVEFGWSALPCIELDGAPRSSQAAPDPTVYRYRLSRGNPELWTVDPETTVTFPPEALRSGGLQMEVAAGNGSGEWGPTETRAFVWNFDPVTRFSRHMPAGGSDSVAVFYADTTYSGDLPEEEFAPFTEGDTLALTIGGIRVWALATGYDPDDVDGDGSVAGYQARLGSDSFWSELDSDRRFRANGILTEEGASHSLLIRATDRLGRSDSTPAEIHLHVNLRPRFLTAGQFDGSEFIQSPMEGQIIPLEELPSPELLEVRFAGNDPDPLPRSPQVQMYLEFGHRVAEYPLADGTSGSEQEFSEWKRGAIDGRWVEENGAWPTIGLQSGGDFVAGRYVLAVRAREFRPPSLSRHGSRVAERTVAFWIQ